MMIYCCDEHIDLALDQLVDEMEVAPKMERVGNSIDLSTHCEYCSKEAIYMVSN